LLIEKGATCVRSTAWYEKTCPTFSDAIALVRRQLREHIHFSTSQQETDLIQIPRALLEVAYPWAADKYLRPLASRLSSVNQPVMLTRNAFSTPRPTPWACL
jgi:hypothetical protein